MSRIEEALRRSGVTGARPVPDPEPAPTPEVAEMAPIAGDRVESAWDFGATGEGAERASATVPPPGRVWPMPGIGEDAAHEPPVEDAGPRTHPKGSLFSNVSVALGEKLVVTSSMPPHLLEEYRKLAATLHHAQQDRGIKLVMVASAVPNEGKTLTASNLALTLSESYRRKVLLIDADLRHPSLHEAFQVPSVTGLSDGLRSPSERQLNLVQLSPWLSLLPGGRPDHDPMSILSGNRMKKVLAEAAENFDWVILDTPPVGLLPDANLLAAMVDAALLVVRAHKTGYDAVSRAVAAIGRERILGVVLNAVDRASGTSGDAYGYGYGYHYYSGAKAGR